MSSWSVKLGTFGFALALIGVTLFGEACQNRACFKEKAYLCQGYSCVNMICLQSCKDNGSCDHTRGFVCKNQKCVCNPDDPKARCHRECFQGPHCDEIKDKDGKILYPTSLGYSCQMPDGAGPGVCGCPAGMSCKPPEPFPEFVAEPFPETSPEPFPEYDPDAPFDF